MRILMVSEDVPAPGMGGLARHALALRCALIKLGHHVDLMGNNDFQADEDLSEPSSGGRFYAELQGQFNGWKEMQFGLFMPPKRSFIARRFARAMMKRATYYDVIHYHGHLPNIAHYIPQSVNFIQTRHDQGSDCLIHTRYRRGMICTETHPAACAGCRSFHPNWLQKKISARAVKIFRQEVISGFSRHKTIFVSDFLQQNLARTFGAGPWGITLHNFIDKRRIKAARATAGIIEQRGVLKVFIAAKLYRAKGVADFLDALVPMLPSHMAIDIAGDGEDEALLRQKHSHPRIRFHGWQSGDATLVMAARADAIVVPSVCEEACPTTVLEALMLGKTTFALARGGTPELAAYAGAPAQLRLFPNMQALIASLIGFKHQPDYPVPSGLEADADHAASMLLNIYRQPPGRIKEEYIN